MAVPFRVLHIEDDVHDALFFDKAVEVSGARLEIKRCSDLASGKAHVRESAQRGLPSMHMVIVDLRLPDGSGLDILRDLREFLPHIPVLVLTTSPDQADHRQAMGLGAVASLMKPLDIAGYCRIVDSIWTLWGATWSGVTADDAQF